MARVPLIEFLRQQFAPRPSGVLAPSRGTPVPTAVAPPRYVPPPLPRRPATPPPVYIPPPLPEASVEGIPCLLSAATTIASTGTGNRTPLAMPDLERLQVPFDSGGFLLEEIRIQLTGGAAGSRAPRHMFLFARFVLDGLEVTNDFFPVWLLAPVIDLEAEYARDTTSYLVAGNTVSVTSTKWRLPKPLYLKPGQTLAVQYQGRAAASNAGVFEQDAHVDTTYAGRLLPVGAQAPSVIAVPYCSHAGLKSDTATPRLFTSEFKNKFSSPLYVQRFTYREAIVGGQEDDGEHMPYPDEYTKLSILAPSGFKCLDQYPQAVEAFQNGKHHWTHGVWLQPDEAFRVQMEMLGAIAWTDVNGVQVALGMVGYREETIR